jgi:hypothetical protein
LIDTPASARAAISGGLFPLLLQRALLHVKLPGLVSHQGLLERAALLAGKVTVYRHLWNPVFFSPRNVGCTPLASQGWGGVGVSQRLIHQHAVSFCRARVRMAHGCSMRGPGPRRLRRRHRRHRGDHRPARVRGHAAEHGLRLRAVHEGARGGVPAPVVRMCLPLSSHWMS